MLNPATQDILERTYMCPKKKKKEREEKKSEMWWRHQVFFEMEPRDPYCAARGRKKIEKTLWIKQ